MRTLQTLTLAMFALPLSAQAWDLRVEAPFATGQGLPSTRIQNQPVSGGLDTGHGVILTASHRIVRMGPVLKFEWNAEWSHLQAGGNLQQGSATAGSRLRQDGLGLGVNAQFWVPFTSFAGEAGLLERFHDYRYEAAGAAEDRTIARPWLRLGLRWVLPFPGIGPYLAASYQAPLARDRPVAQASASNLGAYLDAQNSGQEFQHLWTVGVGISF